jgi:hypothetical protein
MKNFILVIIILFVTSSCQSMKDGLTMKKKNNSDEFLIEKKNPLVLPPDYGQLPEPQKVNTSEKDSDISEIELLLNNNKTKKKKNSKNKSQVEKIILKEIKSK